MVPRYTCVTLFALGAFAYAITPANGADESSAASQSQASPEKTAPDQKTPVEKQLTDINPVGKPKNMNTAKRHDYFVWYSDGWWHIRGSDRSKQSVFYQGSVELDGGEIIETDRPAIDKRKNKKVRDWAVVDRDKKSMKFLFRNIGGGDSVSFRVTDTTKSIKFGLAIDRDNSPDNVRIGPSKKHPATNPFILPAFPAGKSPTDNEKTADQSVAHSLHDRTEVPNLIWLQHFGTTTN